jgi:hypothetical protein
MRIIKFWHWLCENKNHIFLGVLAVIKFFDNIGPGLFVCSAIFQVSIFRAHLQLCQVSLKNIPK